MQSESTGTACDERLLRGYLAHELSSEEETRVESHLDECPACRQRIGELAVEERWWSQAARYLKSDQLDAASAAPPDAVVLRQIQEWLDPADDPKYVGRFGGYEIIGMIGAGGMGVVLKGFEPALERVVAIKVLSPSLAASGAARKRFAREARAAAAVLHENVIAIYRVDESRGLPYLVMPYTSGESLQKRIDDDGPLPLAAILRIGRQIASGLAAAHAQGLVHRDIKPANILLARGVERVTITDFGLARAADDGSVTQSGFIAGTPQYMSPEQARGEPLDARSDLFSLGCVLYALGTGHPPFRAETGYGVLRKITDHDPRPMREIIPEIPEWFDSIVRRLLAKSPQERLQTAAAVAELLEVCLAHVQQPAAVPLPTLAEPRPAGAPWKFVSQRKGVIAVFATLACALIGYALWNALEDRPSADPAGDSGTKVLRAEEQPDGFTPQLARDFATSSTVETIAISTDGGLVAVANGNPTFVLMTSGRSRVVDNWQPTAQIIEVQSRRVIASLGLVTDEEEAVLSQTSRVPYFEVTALAFSPTGDLLAVGTSVGQVKLFQASSGEFIRSIDDAEARLADETTPANLKSLTRAMGRVASLAFSPDGSLLASCGGSFADDPLVWDPVERGGLSVTGPGRLKVWEVDPGSLKHDLVGHTEQANAVAFSHDGNWLASAGNWTDSNGSGTGVIVWNPQTGQRRSTIETDASGGARHVAFSPNDKTVAICTLHFDIDNDTREGALMLVHALSGVVEWKRAVGEWARPARFSPDGQAVAVLCGGTSIKLIQASTGVEKREIRSADSPRGGKWNDFVFGSHGRLLAIGGVDAERNGKVELWNLDGQGASDASPRPEGGN